jgi:hypothetical protein
LDKCFIKQAKKHDFVGEPYISGQKKDQVLAWSCVNPMIGLSYFSFLKAVAEVLGVLYFDGLLWFFSRFASIDNGK